MWSCCPNVHNVELLSQCPQCGVVVPMFTMWSCCPNVHNVELLSQCSQCGVVVPMFTMWSCCPNVHNVELLSQCPQCGVVVPMSTMWGSSMYTLQSKRQDVQKYTSPGHIKWTNYLLAVTVSCRRRRIVCELIGV